MRSGVEHGRMAVGVGERFGDRPFGQPGDLVEHGANGVSVEVAVSAGIQNASQSEHLEEVELDITHVGDVVPHRFSLPWSPWKCG